ncbi:hypothetical protein BUN12_2332 [Bacillus amyloliquefaciens]|jgi:hypothetical protein|uniref:Uncharacterized protein n=1 Tax=Bacillus amyloliquefaciens (strain ATCC 23350 / DSM 7 / BCRC 11601 / CCUG 28519 / NBRC 15535 / NRRL B-14393 / F) TaxID=692420 RepID=A0A9P1JJK4_BACAS|nr:MULTISPECIES: hypothetical protein [Bacillus amyloliquefaciens group]ARW39034.1 hypothetical protein S101267_01946 [Bacillus amyloliquefaciens]AZV90584.1 hypothetical protein BUN12_2332 [Bacillus amyloliquefaciens]MDR4376501.1 hypothetical protein [Bacillus amyloliquefaciens]MEC1841080.1 hypothetical protein [Bacillus amyloliquefaciens]MEC1848455.1 hypothetical protein [Bacillus amyloliquefaciens]
MFNPSDWYITPEEYERAAKNGISRSLLGKRIRGAGWDKERALATPPKKRRPRTDRSKWVEVAEKNGISKATFYWRVTSGGWDEERAATTPIFDRDECMRRARQKSPYGKYRRHSPELIALAESNGIKYKTYAFRVSAGWDPYEAAVTPLKTRAEIGRIGRQAFLDKHGDVHTLFFQKRRATN